MLQTKQNKTKLSNGSRGFLTSPTRSALSGSSRRIGKNHCTVKTLPLVWPLRFFAIAIERATLNVKVSLALHSLLLPILVLRHYFFTPIPKYELNGHLCLVWTVTDTFPKHAIAFLSSLYHRRIVYTPHIIPCETSIFPDSWSRPFLTIRTIRNRRPISIDRQRQPNLRRRIGFNNCYVPLFSPLLNLGS